MRFQSKLNLTLLQGKQAGIGGGVMMFKRGLAILLLVSLSYEFF
jgi:hypothetical protein